MVPRPWAEFALPRPGLASQCRQFHGPLTAAQESVAIGRCYEVVGVCRAQSVGKLDPFKGRITVVPGATNDREVIRRAVEGCDGVV